MHWSCPVPQYQLNCGTCSQHMPKFPSELPRNKSQWGTSIIHPHLSGLCLPFCFTSKFDYACILSRENCSSSLWIKNLMSPQGLFLKHCFVMRSSTLMFFLKPCSTVDYFSQLYHPLPFPLTKQPPFVECIIPDLHHALFCFKCAILLTHSICSFIVHSFQQLFIECLHAINHILDKRTQRWIRLLQVLEDLVPR